MKFKICSVCREAKPLQLFVHDKSKCDNRHHRCLDCERTRTQRRRTDGSMAAAVTKWQQLHPQAVKAHRAVQKAVKAGLLVRMPCIVCGARTVPHGHHDDHSKELAVKWLCPRHHRELHRVARFYGTQQGQGIFGFMEGVLP